MKNYTLTLHFTDDPEDSNVFLVTKDEEYYEITEKLEVLLNAIRDLYVGLLEQQIGGDRFDFEISLVEDRVNLLTRSWLLEKKRVMLCPQALLPQEGELVQ